MSDAGGQMMVRKPVNHGRNGARALLLAATALLTVAPLGSAQAETPAPDVARTWHIELPAQPLPRALTALSAVIGVQVLYPGDAAFNKTSRPLNGDYTAEQALQELLAGTGLRHRFVADGSVTLEAAPPMVDGATMLAPVKVQANAERSSTTEHSGAYKAAVARSATGLDLSPRETPQSITVMTHDRMKDQGLTEIADVMEQVVGIEGNRTSALGSDGTVYYARGFQIENYQVDGMSRPSGVYGFAEETADMIAYDRIEIVRGASGLMTGQGVPSATINLIRKRPTAETQVSLSAKAGSWDRYRVEGDVGSALTDNSRVRGRVAAAYQQSDSFIDREHAERKVVYGVIDADLRESTLLTAGLEYQDFENVDASRGGVPLFFTDGTRTDFSRSTNGGANWSEFAKDSLNAFVALDHRFSDAWRLRLDAEHKEGSYDETIGYIYTTALDRTTGAGGTLYAARWARDLELDGVNASLQGQFDWLGRQHQMNLTLSHASYEDKGPDYPGWWYGAAYAAPVADAFAYYETGDVTKPDLDAGDASAGHKIEQSALSGAVRLKPLDPLAVILGSRVTKWKAHDWSKSAEGEKTITPGADESGVWTPYVGVVFDLGEVLSTYASYTSIFQPQTLKDINGGTLDPLEGNSYELGLKAEAFDGRLDASAAVFRTRQENLGIALGAGIYAPDGSVAYRPSEGAKAKGFELELSGELLPGWKLAGGFTHVKAKDHDGVSLNADIPEDSFKLFTTWQLRDALKDLLVGGNLRWQGTTGVLGAGPNGEDYKQDSLMLLDLLARYALTPKASLTLNVNNLFDKTYYGGLASGSARYGEPRSFSLLLRYELY